MKKILAIAAVAALTAGVSAYAANPFSDVSWKRKSATFPGSVMPACAGKKKDTIQTAPEKLMDGMAVCVSMPRRR